jgi:hypothetical protein
LTLSVKLRDAPAASEPTRQQILEPDLVPVELT